MQNKKNLLNNQNLKNNLILNIDCSSLYTGWKCTIIVYDGNNNIIDNNSYTVIYPDLEIITITLKDVDEYTKLRLIPTEGNGHGSTTVVIYDKDDNRLKVLGDVTYNIYLYEYLQYKEITINVNPNVGGSE